MSFKHLNALELFEQMFEFNVVTAYAGPFDNEMLTILAENLEETLWEDESIRRKFFRIFIELSQNIALYSFERTKFFEKKYFEDEEGNIKYTIKEKNCGEGIFMICDDGNNFYFIAGNYIDEKSKNILSARAGAINSLDREGLRALKRDLRANAKAHGGGNIGLVQVALTSKKPIIVQFIETEDPDKFFYLVCVILDKDFKRFENE